MERLEARPSGLGTMLSGESRFFEESINAGKLRDLLDGRSRKSGDAVQDRLQGMKWLLAMVSKGRDVSQFYPDVVKNVVVKSVELKKLVYVFLMHYTDHDATCRELALLSINSFQKDLADSNPLIRGLALRTMTSIRVIAIVQLQLLAAQKCINDNSIYVVKIAAHALPKIYSLDPSTKDELVKLLRRLLSYHSTMVVGSAMAAFNEICPTNFEIIHPVFRRLCASLVDLDEWSQSLTISVLCRYARKFFARPQIEQQVEPALSDSVQESQARPGKGSGKASKFRESFSSSSTSGRSGFGGGVAVNNGIFTRGGQPGHDFSQDTDRKELGRQLPTRSDLQSFYADDNKSGESSDDTSSDSGSSSGDGALRKSTITSGSAAPNSASAVDTAEHALAKAESGGYKQFTSSGSANRESSVSSKRPPYQKARDALALSPSMAADASVLSISQGTAMEPDHKLLLKACIPLLHSRNSSVVLAVVSVLWHCGRKSVAAMESCAAALVRLVRTHREVQYVALNAMMPMIVESPWYFRPYVRDFFVEATSDARFVRFLKVDALALLLCSSNCDQVLAEFEVYLAHPDKNFVCYVVQAVGRIISGCPELAQRCLRGLMTLMTSPDEGVVAEAVVVTRTLLQQHPSHPAIVRQLVRMMDQTKRPVARASVVWIATEFVKFVPELAPDVLRRLALTFEDESLVVKMQAVNLAVRLNFEFDRGSFVKIFGEAQNAEIAETVNKLMAYVLELARFDADYDLRDRIRFLDAVISAESNFDAAQREEILLSAKPPPRVKKLESQVAVDPAARFAIDSLSHCVGHAAFGNQPLVDWPTQVPDPSLRDPPSADTGISSAVGKSAMRNKTSFYDGGSDSEGSSSDSSSDSGSDSSSQGGASSSESPNEQGDGNSDSDSDSDSSSGSSDSSSDSGSGSGSNQYAQSSSDTDASEANADESMLGATQQSQPDTNQLLGLYENGSQVSSNQDTGNVLASLQSMTLQSSNTNSTQQHEPRFKTLLSNVHGDGLQVDAAFSRQNTVATLPSRCASYSKQNLAKMNTVLLRMTNKLSAQPLTSISATSIKLAKGQGLVPFDTIPSIAPEETVQTTMMVDFSCKPNNPVKFSISSARGTFPVGLEAPCGELLRPAPHLLADDIFTAQSSRLGGMHQASQPLAENSKAASLSAKEKRAIITQTADIACAIIDEAQMRGAAVKLGDTNVVVLLMLSTDSITVCCDDAIFGRLLLSELHTALA